MKHAAWSRRFRYGLLTCTLALLPLSSPAQVAGTQLLRGQLPSAVPHLQAIGRLPATQRMDLAIALPLRNREMLTNMLADLYNPASPSFHQFLTPDQFAAQFGPTESDYQVVINFAKAHGLTVTGTHPNRTLVDVNGAVADIQRAFHVNLQVYQHPTEARTFFAPDTEPSLDLAVPVLSISGLDNYFVPRPMNLKFTPYGTNSTATAYTASGSGPRGNFIGRDFRTAYAPGVTLNGAGQAVALFELDGYFPNDVAQYESLAGLPSVPLTNVLEDGFSGSAGNNNIEVALDIDMAVSMAPGLSRVIIFEGNTPDSILNHMATDTNNFAKQLSCSWGFGASVDAARDQTFQQFATQGQSFFQASGDDGAWTGTITPPSDNPFVTVAGGTSLTMGGNGASWASETAWSLSGGGISTSYPIPVWQQGVINAANQGSTAFRNIPDVAAQADTDIWLIANNGQQGSVGGTSAAAPLWASFTAMVNQQGAAIGRTTGVGFLNPAIYTLGQSSGYAAALHDITTGNNFTSSSPTKFSAVSGYDLCTGWGTPTGSNLISALLANPDSLLITPPTNVTAFGAVGGPFSQTSQNYSLITFGTNAIPWSLVNTSAWLTVSPTNGTIPVGGPATTVTFSLNSAASNLAVGSYVGTVWFTNLNDNFAQSRQFILNVIAAPQITSQPSNQTVVPGGTATFTVGTVPDPLLSFAWRKGSSFLGDGGNIFGSATSTLTVANVSAGDAATYSVVVSNALGSITSTGAVLTVVSLTTSGVTTATRYSFTGGNDGANPNGLIQAGNGAFYGTTQSGGASGSGVIFQWTPTSNPANLYAFTGGNDGSHPQAGLLQTPDGSFYGTTFDGGTSQNGTIFKLVTNVSFASLLSFNTTIGDLPYDQLARGPDGNLYGTTYQGGASGIGTVFKTTTNGLLTSLVSFASSNGDFPYAGLLTGHDGNLYGTTFRGGTTDKGTIFKITTNGLFNTLLAFNTTNGAFPYAGLAQDEFGNFYGLTGNGGASNSGVAFELTAAGKFTNLYSFTGGTDGSLPVGTLIQGNDGNFYGTTAYGGTYGNGTVFRLGVDGSFTTLLQFDSFNGARPYSPLVQGSDGNLYGTTENGGASGAGVIFQITLGGTFEITVNPQSQTVFSGSTVILSVVTSGGLPQSYQWQENGTNLVDGGNVSGSTGRVLTINNASPANVGIYTVTASNAASGAIMSDDAILEVIVSPPVITSQPASQTVSPGATVQFNVGVSGSLPLVYHWQQNGTNLTDGANITGSGSSTLTLTAVTESAAGNYSVVVSNFITSATSSNATLTVIPTTAPGTKYTTLHSFAGGNDGGKPSVLTLAKDGSLYGTTQTGGFSGVGSVFKVAANGSVSAIASFNGANGFTPIGGVVQALNGNFYGVTQFGGGGNNAGNVFMMTSNGVLNNIYSFSGGLDGNQPFAPLVCGPDGNLYGSTMTGGNFGIGNIFRITPAGVLTLLHSFTGVGDGNTPTNALMFGPDGALYGVMQNGGTLAQGSVFRLTTNGVFTTVYSFTGGNDGSAPNGPLVIGSDGNFYGTARHNLFHGVALNGLAFKLTPTGAQTVLYMFNFTDAHFPAAGLIQGSDGNFYGTGEFGGTVNNNGVVFYVAPNGAYSTLVNFDGFDEGAHPETPLVQGLDGNFYGTTSTGGPGGQGNVFRLSATAAPQVTTSPAGQTAFVGSTVSLSVAAYGSAPLNYQWFENSTNLTDGGNLSGSAARVLTLTNVITNNSGNYFVVVSNSFGSATSAVAALTVVSAGPSITSQPATKITALPGATVSLPVTANGNQPLFFQWQKNGTNLTDGVTAADSAISGSATGTLTVANVAPSDAGTYAVLVSNAVSAITNRGTALTVTPVTAPGNSLINLYSFTDLNDGALPNGLALATNGVLYGTAEGGGVFGGGTIFTVASNGAPVAVYAFTGGSDGAFPQSPLLPAADGNFYGAAYQGGDFNGGTLFSFTTNANFTGLYDFTQGSDGAFPAAQLTAGRDGFFYGTTFGAGTNNFGTVFKVSSAGVFSNLYSFSGANDGGQPQSPLVRGLDGNFYGATDSGGPNGYGTIFRITTNGVLANIYNFNGLSDGAQPLGMILQPDGSFLGVTFSGGSNNNGAIFRLTTGGAYSNVFVFGALINSTNASGANPIAGLTPASDGNFYGSTLNGGPFGDGIIFKLTPGGVFTPIAWFDGVNGSHPEFPMVQGVDGNLYGTTVVGGPGGVGTIFRLGISPQPFMRVLTKNAKNSAPLHDFTFTFNSVSGRNYQLQGTTNLINPNWINVGAPIPATNGITTITLSGAISSNQLQFYQVILLP